MDALFLSFRVLQADSMDRRLAIAALSRPRRAGRRKASQLIDEFVGGLGLRQLRLDFIELWFGDDGRNGR
jgi:hypothetical protein